MPKIIGKTAKLYFVDYKGQETYIGEVQHEPAPVIWNLPIVKNAIRFGDPHRDCNGDGCKGCDYRGSITQTIPRCSICGSLVWPLETCPYGHS